MSRNGGRLPSEKFEWVEREAAKTPLRFEERVRGMFQHPDNIAYLKSLLPGDATVEDAVFNFDRIYDILDSDPLAQRGANRPASDAWAELRRVNRVFYDDRMRLQREHKYYTARQAKKLCPPYGPKGRGDRVGAANDEVYMGCRGRTAADWDQTTDEPYEMRMFIWDSLRPPGLEKLNTAGPLYATREDQAEENPRVPPKGNTRTILREYFTKDARGLRAGATAPAKPPAQQPHEKKAPKQATPAANPLADGRDKVAAEKFSVRGEADKHAAAMAREDIQRRYDAIEAARDEVSKKMFHRESDDAWDDGDPLRTPALATAQYWTESYGGFEKPANSYGGFEKPANSYGEQTAWGAPAARVGPPHEQLQRGGGARFMRYESIPFWQHLKREGVDYDIEETLGTAGRELDSHVRGWDMDKLRKTDPNAFKWQRSGPATVGHTMVRQGSSPLNGKTPEYRYMGAR